MSLSEEKRIAIRTMKYRLQELDAKIQEKDPDMTDISSRIEEIQSLSKKLT